MFKGLFKNVSPFIIFIPVALSVIGLIFIYSTGIGPDGKNSGLYIKQIIWILSGLALAFLILNIDYYRLVETSSYYYAAGLIMLIVTFLFGKNIRGSKSWLGVGGLGIQVSEIMKLFYILYFAKYLTAAPIHEKKNRVFFISLLILIAPFVLIIIQPNLGTAMIYIAIFITMSYLGMADVTYIKYLLIIGATSVLFILGVAFYKYSLQNGGSPISILEILLSFNTLLAISIALFLFSGVSAVISFFNPVPALNKILPVTIIVGISTFFSSIAIKIIRVYQWKRILVMISPEFDRTGAGYNIIQSKIAIGSGGFFGKGIFHGTQNTLGFLPEKNTDFIFSVISEEMGFIGSCLIVALYVIYFYYIIRTIKSAKDKEGMLLSAGLLALFFSHFLVNIGMTLGIIPVAGIPLAFISYGGSSYWSFMCAAALLVNIYSRRFVH